MSRLLKLYEIEEFSEVKSIPDIAINETIISNIRCLDEKKELEPFIRQILYDPNETPHGPTEIADIITTHVNIRGGKCLAGFVLKGKSFKNISSKDVAHQFFKLKQINELHLIAFGAVGNIQDDAQRDFKKTASDLNSDYIIMDSQEIAKLLIAYGKICPKDGTPYNDEGICSQGHSLDKGITLEMEVREKAKYQIMELKDVSHIGAKRYTAKVLLDRHYPKDIIRTVIHDVTEELKHRNYSRNEKSKARWKESQAHAVWLYIAFDLNDIQRSNWFCRTFWVDNSLAENMRPNGLKYNEKFEDIEIEWNDDYKSLKEYYESNIPRKEDFLDSNNEILAEMINLAEETKTLFSKYKNGIINENDFISKMQDLEPKANALYYKSGNIPRPSVECEDYDQACQNIFATIHNMFIYYNEKGLQTWPKQNRDWLMQDTINRYQDDLKRIEFEKSKLI